MPKSKTIEIDEILTPGKAPGARTDQRKNRSSSVSDGTSKKDSAHEPPNEAKASKHTEGNDPFSQFQQSLPWKARITLCLTQWFVLLRSKSWGKLVIVPLIILAVLLVVPLGLIALCLLIINTLFFPRR
ncbi:MAG: hypothetical protein ACPIA7_09600 [Akkermansiaceae bacterium]